MAIPVTTYGRNGKWLKRAMCERCAFCMAMHRVAKAMIAALADDKNGFLATVNS